MNKITIFFLGIISSFGALILQTIFTIIFPTLENSIALEKIGAFMLWAIFTEEIIKFGLLWKISKSAKDIFRLSFFLGSGFAIAEIFLNILKNGLSSTELFFPYLGLFLLHIFTASIYGLYFSQKKSPSFWSNLAVFLLGCFFHFLYNFSLLFFP